jgi:dolichol-phosphate mannosyltransferase
MTTSAARPTQRGPNGARAGTTRLAVSVVVPTYNEADSAATLLQRLHDSAVVGHRLDCEVIFVDDGTDQLPAIVEGQAQQYPMPITVHRRTAAVGGLAGAVVDGIRRARHDLVVVMDGDLQHPPERVGDLVRAVVDGEGHDLVVASRYVVGGNSDGHSSRLRRLISRITGAASKALFPRRLRAITDPMSGFFAARRGSLDLDALRPSGFKILLEILARSPRLRVREIPLQFAERAAGESHAGPAEGLRFVRQLLRLRVANRAARFMLVGLSGVLPNLAAVYGLTQAGLDYLPASILAVQVAIIWNFVGAELFVWHDRRSGRAVRRFAYFVAAGETDLLRIPFVYLIVDVLGFQHSVLATLFTIAGAFLLRFTLAEKVVYRRRVVHTRGHARTGQT